MDFHVGQIVKAKAGRDKDGFFIITAVGEGYALIVNGKTRRVENPKKKKLIHLAPTNSKAREFATNREVKRSLTEFLKQSGDRH